MDTSKSSASARPLTEERVTRECVLCTGMGVVVEDVEIRASKREPVRVTCFVCEGAGTVSVYLYAGLRP